MTSIGFNITAAANNERCPYIDLGWVAGRNLASTGRATLTLPIRACDYTVIVPPEITAVQYAGVGLPIKDQMAQFTGRPDVPQLYIMGSDPMKARVSIVPSALLANHKAGELFLPVALKHWSIASTARFLDPAHTNSSEFLAWPTPDLLTLNGSPIPIEHLVKQCNATGQHMKLPLPYKLPDAEMLRVMKLARSLLLPSLKLSVEWSNEVWNFAAGFTAGREAIGKAPFAPVTVPSYEFYGRGAARLNKLVAQVPGVMQDLAWQWVAGADGLKRVVASFIANGGDMALVDALCVAPYISLPGGTDLTAKTDAEIIALWVADERATNHLIAEIASYCASIGHPNDWYEFNVDSGKRRSPAITQAAADIMERRMREGQRVGVRTICMYLDVGDRRQYGIGADYGDAGGDMRRPMIEKLASEWALPSFAEVIAQIDALRALVVKMAA